MKTDVRLSTRFLTAQNAHQVGMLVSLEGGTPVRRAPINVALVLDRSGSMSGMPLEAAKTAAARFASYLAPQDRLSVVVFDESVDTIFGPPRAATPPRQTRSGESVPAGRPTCPAAGSRGASSSRRAGSRGRTGWCS